MMLMGQHHIVARLRGRLQAFVSERMLGGAPMTADSLNDYVSTVLDDAVNDVGAFLVSVLSTLHRPVTEAAVYVACRSVCVLGSAAATCDVVPLSVF